MNRRSERTMFSFAVLLCLFSALASAQSTEKILYTFTGGPDGGLPTSSLLMDATGRLFGTTAGGGNSTCQGNGCGVVFMLTPQAGGGWSEIVLHSFNGTDGSQPQASLIMDVEGNLFGTTSLGGSNSACTYISGCGVVFELQPDGVGWDYSAIYQFAGGVDGQNPTASLIFDGSSTLYGTTYYGGVPACSPAGVGCGTVFLLRKQTQGGWHERVLHRFAGVTGRGLRGGLVLVAGSLYGTSEEGGTTGCYRGCGTVYQLSPTTGGAWTTSVIYTFTGKTDGAIPETTLLAGKPGRLYGTTGQGGDENCAPPGGLGGCGTVFELVNTGSGWTEKVIYSFVAGTDGAQPLAPVTWHNGNLYGTTFSGGTSGCYAAEGCGTVFELLPAAGAWSEKVLYRFNGDDGYSPYWAGLIFDGSGNLYGTTNNGGAAEWGNVFEITP